MANLENLEKEARRTEEEIRRAEMKEEIGELNRAAEKNAVRTLERGGAGP